MSQGYQMIFPTVSVNRYSLSTYYMTGFLCKNFDSISNLKSFLPVDRKQISKWGGEKHRTHIMRATQAVGTEAGISCNLDTW